MELRPAAVRLVLEHGLPVAITVSGRSMEPTLELGAKVSVAPLAPDEPLEAGAVVLVAPGAADVLLIHRVMLVSAAGPRPFVVHQGDAADSAFSTCARQDVLARLTGFAGDPARPLPTLDHLDRAARARFRRRRAACATYVGARGLARRLGVGDLAIVKRCALAFRKFVRSFAG